MLPLTQLLVPDVQCAPRCSGTTRCKTPGPCSHIVANQPKVQNRACAKHIQHMLTTSHCKIATRAQKEEPCSQPNRDKNESTGQLPSHLHIHGTAKGDQNVCAQLSYCWSTTTGASKPPPLLKAVGCIAAAALPKTPGRLSGMALK